MARTLHTRLIVTGTLRATSPIHIGGSDAGIEVDMPVARNGAGQPYAPGTALAGALRAWLTTCIDDPTQVKKWCGYQDAGGDDGAASRLVIEDAHISLPDGAPPEIWHGVGIDRRWGTAAAAFKFERQVLPKGSRLPLNLQLDVGSEDELDAARAMLWHLTQALLNGDIGLGAANTRGLGRLALEDDWRAKEQDWSSKTGVLALLADAAVASEAKATWTQAAKQTDIGLRTPALLKIGIEWQPTGPLMTKAPKDGMAVDSLPMLTADQGQQTLVLPGSGIKGVLRTQAERIVRTLMAQDFVWAREDRERLAQQLQLPLVPDIFGSARPAQSQFKGLRGALYVDNCHATNCRRGRADWRAITQAKGAGEGQPSPLPKQFERQDLDFQHAYHVGVDRWTGGAAESLLFSGLEPLNTVWEPLTLGLNLADLDDREAERPIAFALLWLVLRDLAEGTLGLGFGVNRGYGNVGLNAITLEGLQHIDPQWPTHVRIPISEGTLDGNAIAAGLARIAPAWQTWIDQLSQTTPASVESEEA